MCVDVYSKLCPLTVKYSYELVRFHGPRSFVGRYTLLIENAGNVPLDEVLLLYPRPLTYYRVVDGVLKQRLKIADMAPGILNEITAGVHNDKRLLGNRMTWFQSDPNDPARKLTLEGILDPSNTVIREPASIKFDHVELIKQWKMSAWSLRLKTPLIPGDRHWITFRVTVDNAGIGVAGLPFGDVVYHRLASPSSVWRLFSEAMLAGKETVYLPDGDISRDVQLYDSIVEAFALTQPRKVRIEHYLLEVIAGEVANRVLISPSVDGDLWMRSASPMVVPGPTKQDPQELAFLWKSGVKLAQFLNNATARDIDFSLHFAIVSQPPSQARLWT